MFGWLRDTLANTSPSLSYSHSMIPSHFFRPQQQQNQQEKPSKKNRLFSPSDDDEDETDEESNDNSFYHNPYHSSGQMNYTDVPQQQYTNEHNYPTYLAQQQQQQRTSNNLANQTIDDQIHQKLLLLQQRGNPDQSCAHRQYDYAYRNRTIEPTDPSLLSNVNKETTDEQLEHEEPEKEGEIPLVDEDFGISAYYPGQYPDFDEQFDIASVALWYRNVMRSVKKFM